MPRNRSHVSERESRRSHLRRRKSAHNKRKPRPDPALFLFLTTKSDVPQS